MASKASVSLPAGSCMSNGEWQFDIIPIGRDKFNPQTTGGSNVFQETNPHWLLSFPPSLHLSWVFVQAKTAPLGAFTKNAQIFWALGGSSHLVRETTLLRGTYQPWLLITYKSSDILQVHRTPPKFNSSPQKNDVWKMNRLPFGKFYFQGRLLLNFQGVHGLPKPLTLSTWLTPQNLQYCWWFRNPKQPPGMYKTL